MAYGKTYNTKVSNAYGALWKSMNSRNTYFLGRPAKETICVGHITPMIGCGCKSLLYEVAR